MPCEQNSTVYLQFGGMRYPISSADFNLGNLGVDTCLACFFEIPDQSGNSDTIPSWIM